MDAREAAVLRLRAVDEEPPLRRPIFVEELAKTYTPFSSVEIPPSLWLRVFPRTRSASSAPESVTKAYTEKLRARADLMEDLALFDPGVELEDGHLVKSQRPDQFPRRLHLFLR